MFSLERLSIRLACSEIKLLDRNTFLSHMFHIQEHWAFLRKKFKKVTISSILHFIDDAFSLLFQVMNFAAEHVEDGI